MSWGPQKLAFENVNFECTTRHLVGINLFCFYSKFISLVVQPLGWGTKKRHKERTNEQTYEQTTGKDRNSPCRIFNPRAD